MTSFFLHVSSRAPSLRSGGDNRAAWFCIFMLVPLLLLGLHNGFHSPGYGSEHQSSPAMFFCGLGADYLPNFIFYLEVDPTVKHEDIGGNGMDIIISELAAAIPGIDEAMSFAEMLNKKASNTTNSTNSTSGADRLKFIAFDSRRISGISVMLSAIFVVVFSSLSFIPFVTMLR